VAHLGLAVKSAVFVTVVIRLKYLSAYLTEFLQKSPQFYFDTEITRFVFWPLHHRIARKINPLACDWNTQIKWVGVRLYPSNL